MKKNYIRVLALLLCALFGLGLLSCSGDKVESAEPMDMQSISLQELGKYATLGQYTGIKIKRAYKAMMKPYGAQSKTERLLTNIPNSR